MGSWLTNIRLKVYVERILREITQKHRCKNMTYYKNTSKMLIFAYNNNRMMCI